MAWSVSSPTVGRVSRSGLIPISHSQDSPGPLARSVADAAVVLRALAGRDGRDAATHAAPLRLEDIGIQEAAGLAGVRIGVARDQVGTTPALDALLARCLDALQERGAEVVDPVPLPGRGDYLEAEAEVLLHEFKADITDYLGALDDACTTRSLGDLIAFNEENAELELAHFGQDLFAEALRRGPLTTDAYLRAREHCWSKGRREGIDRAVAEYGVDALVAPTADVAFHIDLVDGDPPVGASSGLAAIAGYPILCVPAGHLGGLPIGISFFGPAWSEPLLLRVGHEFERSMRARREPPLLASVDPEPAPT